MPIEKPPAGTRGAKPPPRLVAKLVMPLMQRIHRRSGDRFSGMDVLYLHTMGARSGQARTSTVARMDDGKGGILVVASAAGAQQHPAWYHNIAAHPDQVWIEFGGTKGNATSNDAADNIAVLTAAIAAIPGSYRRRVLVRLDGAGFSHKLLEHIATGGGVQGRSWEFSVGWSCTDREIDAIDATPKAVWQNATDQDGALIDDTWVADITGLLDLSEWTEKTPGLRIIARDEPLHPKYTQRASDREKARGRRYQLIAVNARTGQLAWLDARHRSHVHVEDDVKQAKAIGLNRWPSRHWKVNVAWITVVAMAASLLAAFRHLGLPDGDLRKASIKSLRFRLFEVPGRITYGQRKTWLHLPADWPWTPDLTASWQTIKTLPIPI